jgi:hypothetical protein
MAIALLMEFDGGTKAHYDAVMKELKLEKMEPGEIFHAGGVLNGNLRVIDVWESQADFDRFFKNKLQRALQNAKVPPPKVTTIPLHNVMK